MSLTAQVTPPSHGTGCCDEAELCTRVAAEFREMPGLRLTLPQVARLFSIEPTRCARVLGGLVDEGHLTTDGEAFSNPETWRRSV
jgi:hypothetical protein